MADGLVVFLLLPFYSLQPSYCILYIVYSFSVTCFQAFLNVDENKVLQVFAMAHPRFCTKYVFRFLHVAFLAVKLQNFALSLVHFFAIALIALTSKCGLRYQKGF